MIVFGILTTFLYFCSIAKAQTDDIKITDLNQVPGLLPVNLGTAKLHDFYKTKIHKIDLTSIAGPLQELDKTWHSISGFMGHEVQLEYLDEKRKNVRKRLENLNQFNKRPKRWIGLVTAGLELATGLVGLYSASNMDTSMYDDVVRKLEDHDQEIRHLNQEISLFSQKIQETNYRVEMLEKNQRDLTNFVVKLQKDVEVQFEQVGQRINTLEQKHDNLQITVNNVQSVLAGVRNNLTLYIQTKQMLDYFENQVNMLNDLIQDVENAFTFAKLGIAHPSLFTSDQLFGMLEDLNVHADQLLFPMSMKNINSFHSILNIRAYKSGSNLVFLISIPIMKKEQYDYYQLVSVPVRRDNTYIHIEPKKPYLLVNDRKFILSDTPCFDRAGMYYCQDYNDFATRNQMSCFEQIVMLEDDYSKCEFETSNFEETEVFPISNDYYIAVNAGQEKFKMDCRTKGLQELQGTQLIYLPEGCSFTLGNSMYMNNKIDMKKFTPVIPHPADWNQVAPKIKDTSEEEEEEGPVYRRLTSGSNIININNFIILLTTFLFLIY